MALAGEKLGSFGSKAANKRMTICRWKNSTTLMVVATFFLLSMLSLLPKHIQTYIPKYEVHRASLKEDVDEHLATRDRDRALSNDIPVYGDNWIKASAAHKRPGGTHVTQIDGHHNFNVLFIVSDDLRPQMNAYQGVHSPNPFSSFRMHTPNLDALAERSLVLTRAYAQFSVCGPSRASFMTGRRPDTTKDWDLLQYWRKRGGNFTSIPQFFKENGYITSGHGKIFHQGTASDNDDPISWTEPYYHGKFEQFWLNCRMSWRAVPKSMRVERPLPDEDVTQKAIENLRRFAPRAKTGKQPFFLGVGFHKPHMPLVCPEEAFKHYPLGELEPVQNYFFPRNFPYIHKQDPEPYGFMDMHHYNCSDRTIEECCIPHGAAAIIRRAYFACVTHVDSLVGELLQELEVLGIRESTIVTFIGDHGFHLGENAIYGKHTNMEQSTHVPFMISIPGRTDRGVVSDSITELVDLFPTVVDASGFPPLPSCPRNSSAVSLCSDGLSVLPLVDDPSKILKKVAISQMIRCGSMGYSIRTDQYRYNEWPVITYNASLLEIEPFRLPTFWDELYGFELYDHRVDPEENANVVNNNNEYKKVRNDLSKLLHEVVHIDDVAKDLYMYMRYFRRSDNITPIYTGVNSNIPESQ